MKLEKKSNKNTKEDRIYCNLCANIIKTAPCKECLPGVYLEYQARKNNTDPWLIYEVVTNI